MIYVCGKYDPVDGSITELRITMPVEVEIERGYDEGQLIMVRSKRYTLTKRKLYRESSVVAYTLRPN